MHIIENMTIFVKNKHTLIIDEFIFKMLYWEKWIIKKKEKVIKKHQKELLKLKIFIIEKIEEKAINSIKMYSNYKKNGLV